MLSDSDGESELRQHEHLPALSGGSGLTMANGAMHPAEVAAAAAATATAPHIRKLTVSKNSEVHFGPKFVSVTQNLRTTEVVKGYVLGLELEVEVGRSGGKTPSEGCGGKTRAQRLRCSVAVFVCWALVVAVGVTLYLLCEYVLAERSERLDLGITDPWFLRRADWQAMPAYGTLELLKRPVRYALVGHSARPWCNERFRCTKEVLKIQGIHQRLGWVDIGPNFLISGNGLVFEGRGANVVGAMVRFWNSHSVSIMFLGDYRINHDLPSKEQMQHFGELLSALVRAGVLDQEYTLLGHCQVTSSKYYSPGQRIIEELAKFKHWDDINNSSCIRG